MQQHSGTKEGLAKEVTCKPGWKDGQELVRKGRGLVKGSVSRGNHHLCLRSGRGRTATWEGSPTRLRSVGFLLQL